MEVNAKGSSNKLISARMHQVLLTAGRGNLNRRGKWPRSIRWSGGRSRRTGILQASERTTRETAVIESRSINIEYQPSIADSPKPLFRVLTPRRPLFHDSSQSSV